MLRIDINLLWTIINLLVLYVLMKKFLFNPVREVLKKRNSEIDALYNDAEHTRRDAENLKKGYEASMASIAEEREKQLNAVKIEASKEYDEIIGNANQKAEKIIQEAKFKAEKDAAERQQKMEEQVASLVAQAAYKIAAAHDSTENDVKLYNKFLNEHTEVKD